MEVLQLWRRDLTRIARLALRLDRVAEIEEAAGVYAEAKIQELAERKMRSDKPELARQWRLLSKIEKPFDLSCQQGGPWQP